MNYKYQICYSQHNSKVDIYLTIYEKICVSEYFIWDFGKNYKLTVFSDENNFDPDIFSEIQKTAFAERSA